MCGFVQKVKTQNSQKNVLKLQTIKILQNKILSHRHTSATFLPHTAPWESFTGRSFKERVETTLTSDTVPWRCPLKNSFTQGTRKKSAGARSGL